MQPTAQQSESQKSSKTDVNDPFGFFDTWKPPEKEVEQPKQGLENDPFSFKQPEQEQKLGEIKDPFASYVENQKQEEQKR